MGSISEKLAYLANTKIAIKNAIVSKGVNVPDETTFREYAQKIYAITGGGGSGGVGTPIVETISEDDTNWMETDVNFYFTNFPSIPKVQILFVGSLETNYIPPEKGGMFSNFQFLGCDFSNTIIPFNFVWNGRNSGFGYTLIEVSNITEDSIISVHRYANTSRAFVYYGNASYIDTQYRYIKLSIDSTLGLNQFQLAEMLFTNDAGASFSYPENMTYYYTNMTKFSEDEDIENLFDGDPNTKFAVNVTNYPAEIFIDLGEPLLNIFTYKYLEFVTGVDHATYAYRFPKEFRLSVSNDNIHYTEILKEYITGSINADKVVGYKGKLGINYINNLQRYEITNFSKFSLEMQSGNISSNLIGQIKTQTAFPTGAHLIDANKSWEMQVKFQLQGLYSSPPAQGIFGPTANNLYGFSRAEVNTTTGAGFAALIWDTAGNGASVNFPNGTFSAGIWYWLNVKFDLEDDSFIVTLSTDGETFEEIGRVALEGKRQYNPSGQNSITIGGFNNYHYIRNGLIDFKECYLLNDGELLWGIKNDND